jgi:capsular exopolysaccharide synthesis family protein
MTTLPQTSQVRLPRPAGMLPAPPQVLNGHGGSGGNGHPAAPSMTAGDVWRVLRGSVWLIIAFVFASAVAGYCINDYLAKYHSRYTAHGYISIKPPSVYDPMLRQYVTSSDFQGLLVEQRTQAMLIKNDSLFTHVLQNPSSPIRNTSWFHSFDVPVKDPSGTITTIFDSSTAIQSLDESFAATPVDQTNLIDISMTYSNKSDARDIVQAIVDQHLLLQRTQTQDKQSDTSEALNLRRDAETNRVKELQDTLHQKALELNIDPGATPESIRFDTHDVEVGKLVEQRFDVQNNLAAVNNQLDGVMASVKNGEEPDGVEARVSQDSDVLRYKQDIDDVEIKMKEIYQEGSNSNPYKDLQVQRDAYQEKLEAASSLARVSAQNTLVNGLQTEKLTLTQQLDSINKQLQTIRDEINEMSTARSEYLSLHDQLVHERQDLATTSSDIDALATQNQQNANGVEWQTRPIIPDIPSFPKLSATMAAAIMAGLALSIGIAFLREMTDTTVRSPRDISRIGNLTLLGMIPHEDDDPQSQGVPLPMIIYQAPTSIMAEGFRQVRTRLQHAASLDTTRSIMVTSSSPGDGKSLVASNLATGLALNGRRILLVDSNFRKPALDKNFGIENGVGFSDVLASLDRFDAAVHKTQVPNLELMTTGARPSNPTELLESQILLDFIERALEEYDHIIFDTGPMLLVSETAALAPRVDGVITVVRARTNSRGLLQRMRDNLRQLKAEHLGVVLNAVRSQGGGYYGRNIKTYYEYQTQTAVSAN